MGKRGPRKTPTKLRIMRGNRGHESKAALTQEPQPADARLDAPKILTGLALATWKRRAPQLADMGVFCDVDRDTLERYCLIYELFIEVWRTLKAEGSAPATTVTGGKKGNPDVAALRGYAADLLAIEREFGMTPSSRTGLVASNGKKEIDPLDAFLRASS